MRALHWLYWNSHDIVDKLCHCYVKVISSYHVKSQHIQELLGALFKHEYAVFNGEQEKESISRVRMG